MANPRHFLGIKDFSGLEILRVLKLSAALKKGSKRKFRNIIAGKTMAMIFEKPSLRTRVSFEAGMTQLGGHAIYLAPTDIGLGVREPVSDVAKVLSRMVDIVMARTFKHETIVELSQYSGVPVVNALSDLEHPCQILADLLTILEKKKKLKGIKLAFIGDGENNVTHSLALAAGILGMDFRVAAPKGYWMLPSISQEARSLCKKNSGKIMETIDPKQAVDQADVIYTDTWVSMGDEAEKKKRLKVFRKYQVDKHLMESAKKEAIFMHDMPAYRGSEVAPEVIDGPKSVVIDQAENRLHAQKGLICFLLGVRRVG